MGFLCIHQVLLRLKPQEETESGIKQRTLDTQDLYTKGSQGVCFVLLDVGLSQLMPNTRQLDMFFRHVQKLQKQPYLLTKVKIGKVVEEIEHVHVHCFTTYNISIKTVKNKVNFVHFVQNNFLSRLLHFLL